MMIYSSIKFDGEKYTVALPSRTVEIKDDKPYLDFFANGGSVVDFMKDENVWGEDLSKYEGFVDAVTSNLTAIKNGTKLI
jgi:hypothetical protein